MTQTFPPLAEGTSRAVQIGTKHIAIFKTAEGCFAVSELCPHRGGPLSEGAVEGDTVTCPWHSAKFSLKTGEVIFGPTPKKLSVYTVTESPEGITVEIPE